MSAHLRSAWASRIEAINRPDEIPGEPGQARIPGGTVRGFHYTAATNLDAIRREGLLLRHARGHVSQEPDAIWFSGANNYWDVTETSKVLLEVAVPAGKIAIGGPSSNFAVLCDVPPTWIVAIHESWHSAYHYLIEYKAEVLAGEHDSMINDQRYGPAIRRIKREGSKTAAKFSPSQVATWEQTKPWNASRQDLEWQNVPGIYVGRAYGTEAASFQDDKIVLKEDYFTLPEGGRRATLYHEAGHGLEEAVGLSGMERYFGVDPLAVINLPGAQRFGHNVSEVVAEAYSVLWTEPQWAKGFEGGQAILDVVTKMARAEGYPLP